MAAEPTTCTDPAPLTVQETVGVGLPVVVRVNDLDPPSATVADAGEIESVPDDGTATVMLVEPNFVESCAEVAVMVAAPALLGVKTPETLTVPMLVGLTDHVTAEL
ncbi:MAG: hypothetical protein WAL75_25335 [Terracidiphilus sp.]